MITLYSAHVALCLAQCARTQPDQQLSRVKHLWYLEGSTHHVPGLVHKFGKVQETAQKSEQATRRSREQAGGSDFQRSREVPTGTASHNWAIGSPATWLEIAFH